MSKFNHARILLQLIFLAISLQPSSSKVCKKQRMQFCQFDGVGQTGQTPLRNLVAQSSQRQIALDERFRALQLLHETGCSDLVKPFTCSIFAPVCLEDLGLLLPPCKSLCEKVKSSCDGFVALARRKPRGVLDCSFFPNPGKNSTCVDWDMVYFQPVLSVRGFPCSRTRYVRAFKIFKED